MVRTSTGSRPGKRRSRESGRTPDDGLPPPPRLQLATFVDTPPSGDEWVHEIKFDGYRIAATLAAGSSHLTTRNLLDWTHRFTSIAAAVGRLPVSSAIIDGEIVALTAGDRSDFAALQHWLSDQTLAATEG